jgi:tetratricopeptide (TPR) repeat protein
VLIYPRVLFRLTLLVASLSTWAAILQAQVSHPEQVVIKPPLLRTVDPPPPDATAEQLEARADELHAQKLYLDAVDYYRAAIAKSPRNEKLLNKVCRTQLMMARWKEARNTCEKAIQADRTVADPLNNLGVALYGEGRLRAAIKQYQKAVAIDGSSASFYSNLGAAYFARRDFDKAAVAYQRAIELDPDVFERTSRAGVQAQLSKPEDHARYDYTVARLYAKMGLSDRSLDYLKKAMEEGYKDLKNVYKDEVFAELRKDKRFTELMASKVPALQE